VNVQRRRSRSLGSPRILRPAWADIEESDDGRDALKGPWSPTEVDRESKGDMHKRKAKIVNKKLVLDKAGYVAHARLDMVAPTAANESVQPGPIEATVPVLAGVPPTLGDVVEASKFVAVEPQAADSSVCHEPTSCKQCIFFFSPFGCNMGDSCSFCHQLHAIRTPSAHPRPSATATGNSSRPGRRWPLFNRCQSTHLQEVWRSHLAWCDYLGASTGAPPGTS